RFLGLVIGPLIGSLSVMNGGFVLQAERLGVLSMAEQSYAGQDGGDDGHGHGHLAIERIVDRMLSVLGVLQMFFGAVRHVKKSKLEIRNSKYEILSFTFRVSDLFSGVAC